MHRVRLLGVAILSLALVGYVIGVVAPYTGRSVTLAGVMAGVALTALPPRAP